MYTIHFLRIPDEESDRLAYARKALCIDVDPDEEDVPDSPTVNQSPLANKLLELFPGMERFDDEEIGEIELCKKDETGQYEFDLYQDGGAALLVSYGAPDHEALWKKLWPCLDSLRFHFGFSAYDEQLNKILDSNWDLKNVMPSYVQRDPKGPATYNLAGHLVGTIVFAIAITAMVAVIFGRELPPFAYVMIWVVLGVNFLIRSLVRRKK